MKYFAIVGLIGVIFFVSNGLSQDADCPVYKLIIASMEACKDQLSEENSKFLEKNPWATNDEINCYRACVMDKAGFMKDAKIDIDYLKEVFKNAKSQDIADATVIIAQECKKQSEVSKNECEVAGLYHKCFMDLKEKEPKGN